MQRELDGRAARVQELQAAHDAAQAAADDLTQRCTQLHEEKMRLGRMLAQRDNELQGGAPRLCLLAGRLLGPARRLWNWCYQSCSCG